MTPSESKGPSVVGTIVGGIIGLIVAVFLSILGSNFSGFNWFGPPTHSPGACGNGIMWGVILLAASAGLGWLAWHMAFRNSSRTFGAGFLRGLTTIVALFLLIPWPCSYTFAAYINFTACAH